MPVTHVLALVPDAQNLLREYGLHCATCALSTVETLEEGCRGHGMSDEDLGDLLVDLNELFTDQPERTQHVTLTKSGAEALRALLGQDGNRKQDLPAGRQVFAVTIDERGSFCLECVTQGSVDGKVFNCPSVPEVRVVVSPLILRRIGGAVIDVREGRFKLDIPPI